MEIIPDRFAEWRRRARRSCRRIAIGLHAHAHDALYARLCRRRHVLRRGSEGQHSNLSTIGFAIGFVLMMVLDVVMG